MASDSVRVENTRNWLVRVQDDLNSTGHLLEAKPPEIRTALFHCQQAAEKALKAFLTWHDHPFRKTHELSDRSAPCVSIDPTLEPDLTPAAELWKYASRFRHPGAPYEPARQEADNVLRLAREVVSALLKRLPPETHP